MRTVPVIVSLLLLVACGAPHDSWNAKGDLTSAEVAEVEAIVEATKRVMPGSYYLEAGGDLYFDGAMALAKHCNVAPPYLAAGCLTDGVWILWPAPDGSKDLLHTALTHELCHVALWIGTDAEAEACARRVETEYRKVTP